MVYLQVTRGVGAARPRRSPSPPCRPPWWSPPAASTARPPRPRRPRASAVITTPENRWGRCDIKTVGLLPNALAKQAAREAGACRGLVRRRAGPGHRRRLVQRLDRRRRRRAAHPRHPRQHPARRHPPAACWSVPAEAGLQVEERPFTVGRGARRPRRPSSPARAAWCCRSSAIDGQASRRRSARTGGDAASAPLYRAREAPDRRQSEV